MSLFCRQNCAEYAKHYNSRRMYVTHHYDVSGGPSHSHPIGNMHSNSVNTGRAVPKIRSRADKQTDIHAHHNTPLRYRGGVIITALLCRSSALDATCRLHCCEWWPSKSCSLCSFSVQSLSCTLRAWPTHCSKTKKVHETITFLLVTLPNIHRFKKIHWQIQQ